MKTQAIRSKGQNLCFYVYLPMPLAAALGIVGGDPYKVDVCFPVKAR